MTNPPDFAGAESPAHPKAEQEFRETKLQSPSGASRDEIARIIDPLAFMEAVYSDTIRGQVEREHDTARQRHSLAKADQILSLPAFAGLLTPSLSHEEEDDTVSRNSGTTCRGAEPAAPANAGETFTVETAAIRIGQAVFTLPRPNRHHNVMWWLSTLGIRSGQMHDQGFVLSNGCYVDRESAAHFASVAGQIERLIAPPYLYSEDLWDGGANLPSVAQIEALTTPQTTPPTPGESSREEPK